MAASTAAAALGMNLEQAAAAASTGGDNRSSSNSGARAPFSTRLQDFIQRIQQQLGLQVLEKFWEGEVDQRVSLSLLRCMRALLACTRCLKMCVA